MYTRLRGGQGMNTGMQDAINLAWKLAWVIKGKSKQHLLDTYEAERRKIAVAVLKFTDTMARNVAASNKLIKKLRSLILPIILGRSFFQSLLANIIGEVRVHYHSSPIVMGEAIRGIKPGDRVAELPIPALQGKCCLLDFSHDINDGLKDFSNIVQIYEVSSSSTNIDRRLRKIKKGYCIVRPDYYIGYIGQDTKEVIQYLTSLT